MSGFPEDGGTDSVLENEEERNWIETLENGDRVAVRAWAQFGGWQNKIKSASVAIYTAAVI